MRLLGADGAPLSHRRAAEHRVTLRSEKLRESFVRTPGDKMNRSDISAAKILIVEDDKKIGRILKEYLESEGFDAKIASSATELYSQFESDNFDLILLDVGLPGKDGFSLAAEVRGRSDVAMIMLTGRTDIVDRIVGIEIGADDYITKPFHLREVAARVRGVLRRTKGGRRETKPTSIKGESSFAFGNWTLLTHQRRLVDDEGRDTPLTAGEFELLLTLVNNSGRVLSRGQLIDMTRGPQWAVLDRTIDAQVTRIRKKIEPDPGRPTFIKSVRGVGYVFAEKVKKVYTQ